MRVMAVDDNNIILQGFEKMLREVIPDGEINTFRRPSEALNYVKEHTVEVAFLDVEMPGMMGIELAIEIKKVIPDCNIIFVTGYKNYAFDAMSVRPSGYLLKPVSADDIQMELSNLRKQVKQEYVKGKLRVKTFGSFAVYDEEGDYLKFSRKHSMEIFAYLIDRRGYAVTSRDIASDVLETGGFDASVSKKVAVYVSALLKDLKEAGYGDVVVKMRTSLHVNTDRVDCDLYRMLAGDTEILNQFDGEYLRDYSWADMSYGEVLHAFRENGGKETY